MFDYPEGKMHPKSDWGYCVQAEVAGTSMGALRLVLTEQQEGRLALMGGTRDPEACYEYLRRSGAIVQDPDLFPAYWQELALRRFSEEYVPQIRKYSTLHPLRDTLAAVLRRRQTDARKKRKALDFLNLVRNESHSEAVHTALGLQTGADADLRTPRIRNDVDELLAWTR
jgi:poly-gamma-glutamate synthesis protein (capsule biosynthesis protein)